jgi:hypothetical protein
VVNKDSSRCPAFFGRGHSSRKPWVASFPLWFSAVGYRRLSRYYMRASAFVEAVLGALEAAAPLQSAKKARVMQRAILQRTEYNVNHATGRMHSVQRTSCAARWRRPRRRLRSLPRCGVPVHA